MPTHFESVRNDGG